LSLHLPLASLKANGQEKNCSKMATINVCPGGMYLKIPENGTLADVGSDLTFCLSVPAGDGYSPRPGQLAGTGKVLRIDKLDGGALGLAVRFDRKLSLNFQ